MKKSILVSFLLFLLHSSIVHGANLLVNPHFDTGIASWSGYASGDVVTLWTGIDADSSPNSGSFVFINTSAIGNGAGPIVSQCVAITGGAKYDVGVKVLIPPGQSNTGWGSVGVDFYSGPGCTGTATQAPGAGVFSSSPRFDAASTSGFVAPASAVSARVHLQNVKNEAGGSLTVQYDDVFFGPTGSCVPDKEALCLNDGRFKVQGWYWAPTGSGNARVQQLTSDSGYLWFFSAPNIEAVVKVLNACGVNSRFWVFAGGLTNVNTRIDVTDMKTGTMKSYLNPASTPFEPIQDTDAFATCP